jgi:hypothetical protein
MTNSRRAPVGWTKFHIWNEWQLALPDRFDPKKAVLQPADKDGYVDGENGYSEWSQIAEASPQEVKALFTRYKAADEGLLWWDEVNERLVHEDR